MLVQYSAVIRVTSHEHHNISNHTQFDYSFNRLFRPITYLIKALLAFCRSNPYFKNRFPAQRASDPESISMLWYWLINFTNPLRNLIITKPCHNIDEPCVPSMGSGTYSEKYKLRRYVLSKLLMWWSAGPTHSLTDEMGCHTSYSLTEWETVGLLFLLWLAPFVLCNSVTNT